MRQHLGRVSAIFARTIGGHDAPVPPRLPGQSDAIVVARVICILGIVYAHAWTGRGAVYLLLHSADWQGMMRAFFVETIGRSSVPLLGMVSGWLVASSALKRDYWSFIKGKARTILAPMLIWNALALLLVGGAMWMGWNYGPRIFDLQEFIFQELTSFTVANHINFQTPFLRDLFVLMLLAPVLIRMRSWALGLLLAAVLVWSVFDLWFPLILRPQVALFFLVGIMARRFGWAGRISALPWWVVLPPFIAFAATKWDFAVYDWWYAWKNQDVSRAIEVGLRLSAAALMWKLCMTLAAKPAALARFRRLEPYVFLLFCSHMILIWLFAQHIGRWVGPLGTPFYPLFFLAHPLLVLLGAIGIGKGLLALSPWWASLMSGGRLKREENQGDRLTAAVEAPIRTTS